MVKLMFRFLAFFAPILFFSPFSFALENKSGGMTLNGYLSLWVQDCSALPCALPKVIEANRPESVVLNSPQSAGGAALKRIEENFNLKEGTVSIKIGFYALHPYQGDVFYQVQAELGGLVKAFCAASLNKDDFSLFPVFMCAGYKNEKYRLGVTLHRNKFRTMECHRV